MSLLSVELQSTTIKDTISSYVEYPGHGIPKFKVDTEPRSRGKAAKDPSSHFLLRGGKWNVPDEYLDEMLWHYAITISERKHSSIVERRTELFRFHMDLDFNQRDEVSIETVRKYVIVFQETLRKFFPWEDNLMFECTLSAAPTKEVHNKDANVPVLTKTGFHIIWVHLWVTEEQALAIRASMLVFIQKRFGKREPPLENLWEDVIDQSIYISNGLRMIGAVKYGNCGCSQSFKRKASKRACLQKVPQPLDKAPVDAQASSSTCEKCSNKGYMCEFREYWLERLWNSECEPVTRRVFVPTDAQGPCYKSPLGRFEKPVYYADPMPDWGAKNGTVPFAELLYFGNGKRNLEPGEDAWHRVRKIHNTLRATSLRMPPDLRARVDAQESKVIPEFVRYKLAPPAPSPAALNARLAYERSGRPKMDVHGHKFELYNEYKSVQRGHLCYVTDEDLIRDVEKFIQLECGVRKIKPYQPYSEIMVTNILYTRPTAPDHTPRSVFVHVAGVGSAYCQNKQDDHNGNSIYFEIGNGPKRSGPKWVYQKCFCRCDVVRTDGKCQSFKKPQQVLPSHLEKALFGKDSNLVLSAEPVEKLPAPPSPFNPYDFVTELGVQIDADIFEERRRQKREREAKLGLPDPGKRLKSILDANQKNGPDDCFEYH